MGFRTHPSSGAGGLASVPFQMRHGAMMAHPRRLAVIVPADFVMSRDMLRGVKQRAESLASADRSLRGV